MLVLMEGFYYFVPVICPKGKGQGSNKFERVQEKMLNISASLEGLTLIPQPCNRDETLLRLFCRQERLRGKNEAVGIILFCN